MDTLYRAANVLESSVCAVLLDLQGLLSPGGRQVYLDEDGAVSAVLSSDSERWFVPLLVCHCGDLVTFDGTWSERRHRRCNEIP